MAVSVRKDDLAPEFCQPCRDGYLPRKLLTIGFCISLARLGGESPRVRDIFALEGHVLLIPTAVHHVARVGAFSLLNHLQRAAGLVRRVVGINTLEFATVIQGDPDFLALRKLACTPVSKAADHG